MSTNYIIQMSQEPIDSDSYITEDKYYENFCGCIAQYTEDISEEDMEYVISDFKDSIHNAYPKHTILGDNSITFKEGFDAELNKVMTEAVRKLVAEGDYREWGYKLQKLTYDRFGIYIDSEYTGLEPEQYFLESGLDGRTFYFGGVVAYD